MQLHLRNFADLCTNFQNFGNNSHGCSRSQFPLLYVIDYFRLWFVYNIMLVLLVCARFVTIGSYLHATRDSITYDKSISLVVFVITTWIHKHGCFEFLACYTCLYVLMAQTQQYVVNVLNTRCSLSSRFFVCFPDCPSNTYAGNKKKILKIRPKICPKNETKN